MLDVLIAPIEEFRRKWAAFATCLGLGLAGALVFSYLTAPLPWVIGPMFVTGVAAMAGVNVWVPRWLRAFMFAFMGALFGTTVTPDITLQATGWLPSMAAVLFYVAVATGLIFAYLHWIARLDSVTSYFSAAPGGLLPMVVIGGSYGGDERTISLTQMSRLVVTVMVIPVAFRLFGGYHPTGATGVGISFADITAHDALYMIAASVVAIPIAKLCRLPAPTLMGPMIAVGALTLGGIVVSKVPDPLVAASQLVIGGSIGAMFNGLRLREVARTLWQGSVAALLAIIVAIGFAFLVDSFSAVSAKGLILAFAPGGFAEMALIAFALGIDVTFVVAHQLVRFAFIVTVVPLLMAVAGFRPVNQNAAADSADAGSN